MPLSGRKIVVLGGDRREIVLTTVLVDLGASVTMLGFRPSVIPPGAAGAENLEYLLEDAEILILPLSGTDNEGKIRTVYTGEELYLTEKQVEKMRPGTLLLVGEAKNFLKAACERRGIYLVEIGKMDELAILNSIPTAEGAIQIAMRETDVTLHGTPCTVVGLGRTGFTLARTLKALGADVTVAERNPGKRARAQEMGCQAIPIEALSQAARQGGVIFNTVPALVLNREVLRYAHPELFILDLASKPGGTDFGAAADFGIKAILAPGLPGKVAPYSAGRILARVVVPILEEYQGLWNEKEE